MCCLLVVDGCLVTVACCLLFDVFGLLCVVSRMLFVVGIYVIACYLLCACLLLLIVSCVLSVGY